MKLIHSIPLIIATACLAITGCDKKIDEKTAIANFKTDVENFSKWAKEKSAAAKTDPVAGIAMMGELSSKFKSIKTDGLPTDLKSAWTEMGGVLGEMADLFKDLKIPKAEKPEDNEKAMAALFPKMMELAPKMEAIKKKGDPIMKKLKEVGTKYGLDMSKVAPGGKGGGGDKPEGDEKPVKVEEKPAK